MPHWSWLASSVSGSAKTAGQSIAVGVQHLADHDVGPHGLWAPEATYIAVRAIPMMDGDAGLARRWRRPRPPRSLVFNKPRFIEDRWPSDQFLRGGIDVRQRVAPPRASRADATG